MDRGCGLDVAFDPPERIEELSSDYMDVGLKLSSDGLAAYFASDRASGVLNNMQWLAQSDLYVAHRAPAVDRFEEPELLFARPGGAQLGYIHPSESSDGTALYFEEYYQPPSVITSVSDLKSNLMRAVRPSRDARYGAPRVLDVGDVTLPSEPFVIPAPNGSSTLFYAGIGPDAARTRITADFDLFQSTIVDGVATPGIALPGVNTKAIETSPVLTSDGLTLYFTSSREGNNLNVYVTSRTSTDAPFAEPRLVTELKTAGNDEVSFVSDDNCTLYLYGTWGNRSSNDLYVARKRRYVYH